STYQAKYPDAENAEWRGGGAGDSGQLWESREKIRLAEYFRIRLIPDTLYMMADGQGMLKSDPRFVISAAQYQDGKPVTRKTQRRQVEWYRLNGMKVVERQVMGGKVIPVSRGVGNILDLNGRVSFRGLVADLMEANRMLNYWSTCETEVIALAPRAPYIVAEGQIDGHNEWKDANQKPSSVLTYKPVHSMPEEPESPVLPPPQRIEPVAVPAGFVQARQTAVQDLMMLAGMPHEPRADLPG